MTPKQPAIVAELGRPETADETADRKAAASRERRSNQTILNLVIATVASLGIVAFLIAVVVRPDNTATRPAVDYASIAAQADEAVPLLAPAIPADWYANDARITAIAGVRTWSVGFVTGEAKFIGLDQGVGVDPESNPSWLAAAVEGLSSTGTVRAGGLEWTVYDHRDSPEPGNYAYVLSAVLDGSVVVLHGTAPDDEFEVLAASVAGAAGGAQ